MQKRTGNIQNIEDMDLETLIALAEHRAVEYDGHITILRFTTGWKVMYGTPNLDTGEGRNEIGALKSHHTLKAALVSLVLTAS